MESKPAPRFIPPVELMQNAKPVPGLAEYLAEMNNRETDTIQSEQRAWSELANKIVGKED